jgi:hypothetical protein
MTLDPIRRFAAAEAEIDDIYNNSEYMELKVRSSLFSVPSDVKGEETKEMGKLVLLEERLDVLKESATRWFNIIMSLDSQKVRTKNRFRKMKSIEICERNLLAAVAEYLGGLYEIPSSFDRPSFCDILFSLGFLHSKDISAYFATKVNQQASYVSLRDATSRLEDEFSEQEWLYLWGVNRRVNEVSELPPVVNGEVSFKFNHECCKGSICSDILLKVMKTKGATAVQVNSISPH